MTRNENEPHSQSSFLWKCIFSYFCGNKMCLPSSAPHVVFLITFLLCSRLSCATSHVDRPNTHYITKLIDNHYDENKVIYQQHQQHSRGKHKLYFTKINYRNFMNDIYVFTFRTIFLCIFSIVLTPSSNHQRGFGGMDNEYTALAAISGLSVLAVGISLNMFANSDSGDMMKSLISPFGFGRTSQSTDVVNTIPNLGILMLI